MYFKLPENVVDHYLVSEIRVKGRGLFTWVQFVQGTTCNKLTIFILLICSAKLLYYIMLHNRGMSRDAWAYFSRDFAVDGDVFIFNQS